MSTTAAGRSEAPYRSFETREEARGSARGPALAQRAWALSPWIGLPAGAGVLAWAYSYAAGHAHEHIHTLIFWIGISLFVVPAASRLVGRGASDTERYCLLIALGLFLFLPKFLRDPSMPLFHDELAHWRQTTEVIGTGKLFHPNYTVIVAGDFPGLHALTAAVSLLTGLSVFRSATALLATLHVLSLIGVAELARLVVRPSVRLGGIAALVYAMNPSYMFFHAQFAYESMGIVLFIWTLVAVAHLTTGEQSARGAAVWFGIALVLMLALVMTHHVSSYLLLATLTAVGVTAVVEARRSILAWERARAVVALVVLLAVSTVLWAAFIAPNIDSYLSPYLTNGFNQVTGIIGGESPGRSLFEGTSLPFYEEFCGIASVGVVAAALVEGLIQWRRTERFEASPLRVSLIGLSLVYLASLPFLFSSAGAESAHRSWGFAFVGVAIVVAPAIEEYGNLARGRLKAAWSSAAVLAAGFAVVMIGNVANSVNEPYRFPGPFVWGSDTRSLSPELLALTRTFRDNYGEGRRVISDRYSSSALSSFGGEQTFEASAGFPFWELYFDRRVPPPLLRQLADLGIEFLVVDRRMSRVTPLLGFYINPLEQPAHAEGVVRPSNAALSKFKRLAWATQVMQSDNYDVFRLDPAAMRRAASR